MPEALWAPLVTRDTVPVESPASLATSFLCLARSSAQWAEQRPEPRLKLSTMQSPRTESVRFFLNVRHLVCNRWAFIGRGDEHADLASVGHGLVGFDSLRHQLSLSAGLTDILPSQHLNKQCQNFFSSRCRELPASLSRRAHKQHLENADDLHQVNCG